MAENRCDELLGKNDELVEFRKKIVLEGSFGIIRRHYKDKSNKMEVIAALFGKELDEEFTVRGGFGEYKAYFAKDGFIIKVDNDLWYAGSSLVELLTGEAAIVNE